MFDRLKNNSIKILVFIINILLAVIAVFIIREKDQARLLESWGRQSSPSGNSLPSFRENINLNSVESDLVENSAETQPSPASQSTPKNEDIPNVPNPSAPVPKSSSKPVAPAPVVNPVPVDRKTKTS